MTHVPGHRDDDPGCTKCVIDNGMTILTAPLYGDRIAHLPVRALDKLVPFFYGELMTGIFQPVALRLHSLVKHGSEQHTRLMEQIDKECYRADELLAWCEYEDAAITPALAKAWTNKILGWAKDNQTFYTALSAEIEKE